MVATKFLPRTQEEIEAGVTGQQHIERMLNTSLKNLGMDYVDLYIYHMWDYQTPLYDILDGLNRVVKAGKARYIGISNCLAYQLAKANDLAREEGFAQYGTATNTDIVAVLEDMEPNLPSTVLRSAVGAGAQKYLDGASLDEAVETARQGAALWLAEQG